MKWLLRPKRKAQTRNLRQSKKFPSLPEPSGNPYVWNLGRELEWGSYVAIRHLSGVAGYVPHQGLVWLAMTQQWDTTVSNDDKPTEKARAIRARQRAIGRELRRMYDDVAQEPVPDDFMDLLRQIDEAEDKSGKKVS